MRDFSEDLLTGLGTRWVGRGKGSTLRELCEAAGHHVVGGGEQIVTDLELTGRPFRKYDRVRLNFVKTDRLPVAGEKLVD